MDGISLLTLLVGCLLEFVVCVNVFAVCVVSPVNVVNFMLLCVDELVGELGFVCDAVVLCDDMNPFVVSSADRFDPLVVSVFDVCVVDFDFGTL